MMVYYDAGNEKIKNARNDELKLNQMKLLHVSKKRIVIAKTENCKSGVP
jgi:hypothetical protein